MIMMNIMVVVMMKMMIMMVIEVVITALVYVYRLLTSVCGGVTLVLQYRHTGVTMVL
jgi:hypothetical protein